MHKKHETPLNLMVWSEKSGGCEDPSAPCYIICAFPILFITLSYYTNKQIYCGLFVWRLVFQNVTPSRLLNMYQHFRWTCYLHPPQVENIYTHQSHYIVSRSRRQQYYLHNHHKYHENLNTAYVCYVCSLIS